MPFTLFHLGPALAAGLPLRKYLHAPTFIVANVIVDIEPLLVIVFGFNYPLHGYLHTVTLASAIGILLGFAMFQLEKPMQPFYRKIRLEANSTLKLKSFLLAGVFGTILHVLFDAFLYGAMDPFFPWTINPLLNVGFSTLEVYMLCLFLGFFGIAYYVVLFAYSMIRKGPNNQG